MSYVLGIDLGTSSLKGLLVDKNGSVKYSHSSEYPLIVPEQGFSEQDPKEWFEALKTVVKNIIQNIPDAISEIKAISFSGQMHSLVLLDEKDNILRNAILWNDVRTTKQCNYIVETLEEELINITKNKALEGFTLPKLLWVKENEPKIWNKISTFLLPKDYLGFCLTGNKQMDYSDAAGTLLLDIENKSWSEKILKTFNINPDICPKLVKSVDRIGNLKEELVLEFGLENTIPIFAGGADNPLAAISSGIVEDGTAMVSIGTSGVFLTYETDGSHDYNGNLHFFNHVIENAFYSMGVTLSAGNSLSWYKNTFSPNETYESLLSGIKNIPSGSNGLIFTPYIVGERTPFTDSQIRGSFTGIDTSHTKTHFTKAIIEGITFSLKDSQVLMERFAGKNFENIISVGGGAKNKDWLQIQADIFDAKIITLKTEQGPALGAAMVAAVGIGWFADLKSCSQIFVQYKDTTEPDPLEVAKYKRYYKNYQSVYPAIKNISS